MNRLVRFLILLSLAAVFTLAMPLRPVAAGNSCSNLIFDGVLNAGDEVGPFNLTAGHTYVVYRNGGYNTSFTPTTTGPYTFEVFMDGHYVGWDITCGQTFFNPGDGRAAPLAGDRIVAYCNTTANPPTLDIWGVTNDSQGHRLFTFTVADLLKAGKAGILNKVEPMGSVFASTDGNGNFWVQWFGGPASATGTKDFAKSFACSFSK